MVRFPFTVLYNLENMEINSILLAFLLTMIAGLSTGVGSLIAFFAKRTNTKFLSAALGFSAGVMIYISFMELMPLGINRWLYVSLPAEKREYARL